MPRQLNVWSCSHTLVYIIFTGAVVGLFLLSWGLSKDPPELKNLKTFGLGMGPTYLDTFDVPGEKMKIAMYEEYFGYKKLMRQISEEETANYKKWYATNKCLAGCPPDPANNCVRGICWCDDNNPEKYGQCRPKSEAKYLGDKEKYRKPDVPPLPDHCYIMQEVNGRMQNVVDDLQAHKPECWEKVTHPNVFDLETQTCNATQSCFDIDMNLICGKLGKCQCRQDMGWNVDRMQCEIYLGVDCSDVTAVDINGEEFKKVKEMLHGQQIFLSSTQLDQEKVKTVYCNLMEEHSKEHVKYKRGGREPPDILGYFNTIGFIFFIAGCMFGVMWCLMIFGLMRLFIRSFDPRNAFHNMSTGEKITALGVVAGQEMVERQGEREDERRAALMQGQNL